MITFIISLFPVFGNIHGHTSYSDGKGTPTDAYGFAKFHNLKLYGLTDHAHYLDTGEWENTLSCANSFTDTDFIALCGQEVGKLNYFGHINVYGENLNEVVPERCWYNLDSLYEYINIKGLIGIFNHPWENHFNSFEFKEKYKNYMCGIEIMNKDSVYEKECIRALTKGWELAFIASQDNHEWNWGIERNQRGRILQTAFMVDSLCREEIFNALRERRTYAFELFPDDDTIFLDFRVDDSIFGKKIIKDYPYIKVTLQGKAKIPFIKIFIFMDTLIDSLFIFSNFFHIEKNYYLSYGKHFMFAKLQQADFDRAWSSPVFIEIKNISIIYPCILRRFEPLNKDIHIFSITGRKIENPKEISQGILFLIKGKKVYKSILIK